MEYLKTTKNSQQTDSETVTNENKKDISKETPKERYISPEESQKIIDKLDINIIVP